MSLVLSAEQPSDRRKRAEELLAHFGQFTDYGCGDNNRFLQWLRTVPSLSPNQVVGFLNAWYPISRHQPQILLFLTSLFPEQADRRRMFVGNIREEDGYRKGYQPHYDLLGKELIPLLGGTLQPNPVTDRMNLQLRALMMRRLRTPAQAAGALAAIEFPALDVSDILRTVVGKGGRADVVSSNLYLTIHVTVEPEHIIDTHETALRFMEQGERQRREVVEAFRMVMAFWGQFWPAAESFRICTGATVSGGSSGTASSASSVAAATSSVSVSSPSGLRTLAFPRLRQEEPVGVVRFL